MITENEYIPHPLIKPEEIEGMHKREEDQNEMHTFMKKYCLFYDLSPQTLEQGLHTTIWRASKAQIDAIRKMQETIVLQLCPQPYELVAKYLNSAQSTTYEGMCISGGNRVGQIYINNRISYPSSYFDTVRNHESIHALHTGDMLENGFHKPFAFGTNLNEATTELLRIYGELCQWKKGQHQEIGDVQNAIEQEIITCYYPKETLLLIDLLQEASTQEPVVPCIAALAANSELSASQKCTTTYDFLKNRRLPSLSDDKFELMWAALIDDFTDWENLYHCLEHT